MQASYHKGFAYLLLVFLFFAEIPAYKSCECPVSNLGQEVCSKYEVILRGKVLSVRACDDRPGEAVFEVLELYKGNAEQQFKLLFQCDEACYYAFQPGEEWIIYSRYRQVNTGLMDFCSRSRRWIRNDAEDFYQASHGNTYEAELKFLRDSLGLHRLVKSNAFGDQSRNKLPNPNESVIILLVSIAVILLFYFLFSRYVK